MASLVELLTSKSFLTDKSVRINDVPMQLFKTYPIGFNISATWSKFTHRRDGSASIAFKASNKVLPDFLVDAMIQPKWCSGACHLGDLGILMRVSVAALVEYPKSVILANSCPALDLNTRMFCGLIPHTASIQILNRNRNIGTDS
ncbi:hypothetical protein HBI12_068610 [Parastagonospora nodorum]|nr:hypothetical protein HBI12_068610 [Parastagonospora nodorum]